MSTNPKQSKQSRIQTKLKYAVLICDSFETSTSAIQTYNCLSQFDEFPAVWYTLNWLTENSVQEVFVLYSKDKERVEEFFERHDKSIDLKCHLNYVKPGELKSFGDAIRQIQFRNLVNEDFLILYANTITNIDLSKMILSHFTKKEELKSVVLTSSFQEGFSKNIHLLNSATSQILQIQSSIEQELKINTEKINLKKVAIEFRRDIVPCEIFICTVEVLKSFKESYEYTTMNEFIIGMLTSEVYEEKINAYIIQGKEKAFRTSKAKDLYQGYMAYISNYMMPYSLHSVEQLQPRQRQLKRTLNPFSIRQHNAVIKHNCKVNPSVKLSNTLYIGENTTIQQNSVISRSVILKNCKIGANVRLQNCMVLQNCEIKSNSTYKWCKFENVGNTLKIVEFRDDVIEKIEERLMEKELYEETPNDSEEEERNFEEELENLLKEEPNSDSVIDLFTLRKSYNKELNEFTKEMIRMLQPSGVKGVEEFVQKWGNIVYKLHEEQELLLDSITFSCENIDKYNKAVHIFLQYFYIEEILSKEAIKKWFENEDKVKKQVRALCKPFLQRLNEDSEQEQEEDDEDEE